MKILMFTSRFGFGYGMGYAAYSEAIALANLNNSVTVVHCNNSPDVAQYNDARIKFFHLPIKKIPVINFILFAFKLRKFLKYVINLKEFDLIYVQSLEFGVANFSNIGIPIFYFARSTISGPQKVLLKESGRVSFITKVVRHILIALEKRCMYYSKIIFVKSTRMIDEVSSLYNVDRNKITLISGGINIKEFHKVENSKCVEFKKKIGIPLNEYIVLYAGRIVPQKGLIYLIKAALNLLKEFNFAVVIAGADLNELYASKVKQLVNNNIYSKSFYFLGHIDQLNMAIVLNSADCLVTPSLYEPFGMINLQAAFLGKNIITTNVVGSIDLLKNYDGIKYINPGSETSIESSLKEILTSKTQQKPRNIDLSRYSWKYVAEQLLKCFSTSV